MTLNLKPTKSQSQNSSLKEDLINSVKEDDKTKISVDIDTNIYLKILELKIKTKKNTKHHISIKNIVNKALAQYLNSLEQQ